MKEDGVQGPDAETFQVIATRFVVLPLWVMELGVHETVVYSALATFANADHQCWPSHESIAARAHISSRSVRTALAVLEAAGACSIERRRRADGGKRANIYTLFSDPPSAGRADGYRQDVPEVSAPRADELEPVELGGEEEGLDPPLGDVLPAPLAASHASAGAREAQRLCEELQRRIVENGCRPPTITKGWLDAARLLVDSDGVSPDEVSVAIQWSTRDSFWKANILSMPTLRRQFDRLRLAAERDGNGAGTARQREYDDAMRSLDEMIQEAPA